METRHGLNTPPIHIIGAKRVTYKCDCGQEFSSYNKWAKHKAQATGKTKRANVPG